MHQKYNSGQLDTSDGNSVVNGATVGTSGQGVVAMKKGVVPSTTPSTDIVQLYADIVPSLVTAVPQMTSNTAPSGVVSASSNFDSTTLPWKAFNRDPTSSGGSWLNNGSALPAWIAYQFTSAKVIIGYTFYPWDTDNFPSRCPTAWVFQGSNDGTTYTTLHTATGQGWSAPNVGKTFSFLNATGYTYYRIYITANGGNSYTGLRFVSLYEGVTGLAARLGDGSTCFFARTTFSSTN
jgi:hypothetical protein